MRFSRNLHISPEGWPFLLIVGGILSATWYFGGPLAALLPAAAIVLLVFIFHDPWRMVPAVPLGVVSPVDGEIVSVGPAGGSPMVAGAQSILLRINALGTYSARSPVEGKALDVPTDESSSSPGYGHAALWLRTDEGFDVVMYFNGYRFGLAPRAILRYGDRVGQGQRCAYLRLTKYAAIELPPDARIVAEPGQRVVAGRDLLAKLPHT